jgi:hypothetical protein
MKDSNLPFSGKISFMETGMYWPVNHMVASKEMTVRCNECHTRTGSRLAGLTDFYMPGRDYFPVIDSTGQWVFIMVLTGIAVHAAMRMISSIRMRASK